MLKVLIADDEQKVCMLIRGLIPWESLGFSIVGMANDGLSALSQIEETRPDILITDIRMPGLDGIQLIGEAKKLLPALRCIIISGYRHFDYAHNAIKYGVEDYLLKPLQKAELIETLTRMQAQSAGTNPANAAQHANDFLQDCFVGTLSGDALDAQAVQARYGVSFPLGTSLYALMVKADLEAADEAVRRIATERIASISYQVLSSHDAALLHAQLPEGLLFVASASPDAESAMLASLQTLCDRGSMMRDLFPTLRVSSSISRASQRLSDLPALMVQAHQALQMRLTSQEGAVFRGQPTPVVHLPLRSNLRADTLRRLTTSLTSLDADAYAAVLADAFSQMREIAGSNYLLLHTMLREMVRLHFEQLPLSVPLSDMEDVIARLGTLWNAAMMLRDVEAGFVSLLLLHMNQARETQAQVEQRPLRLAKAYIREHYREPLTLETVSSIAGFNPAYFSTLFKKETGERFTEYLASVRIGAAKQLLTDSDRPIAEISAETGYGDYKYFCKQFKKATGLSPQAYRKMYS